MTDVIYEGIGQHTPRVRCVNNPQFVPEDNPKMLREMHEKWPVPLPISTENSLRMLARYTDERCGLIDSRLNLHHVNNVHQDRDRNFRMDMNDMRKTIERIASGNDSVIGVFHTHPGGSPKPSLNDIQGWPNVDLRWRYFIVTPHFVYEWQYVNQPENHEMLKLS